MKDTLTFDYVSKAYGSFKALDDVSVEIKSGEFMTLLGPSGSGKTTMLMSIAGFTEPTSGQILLDGRDIVSLPPEKRNFGLVFQGYALFPHMTIAENVAYPLKIRKLDKETIDKKVANALGLIQLHHLAGRYPKQLSGGQQQRVALARALVFEPDLLLLDEPLSALDRALRKDLQAELKEIHDQVGTTFIYVTHDQEEALSMSDRISILRGGRIEQLDAPATMYNRPKSIFVANFLGKSNFLQAEKATRNGQLLIYTVHGREFSLSQPDEVNMTGDFSVAIRPENLRLCSPDDSSLANKMQGRITKSYYFGQVFEVNVDTGHGDDLMVIVPNGTAVPNVGDNVCVGWDTAAGVALPGRPEIEDNAYAN